MSLKVLAVEVLAESKNGDEAKEKLASLLKREKYADEREEAVYMGIDQAVREAVSAYREPDRDYYSGLKSNTEQARLSAAGLPSKQKPVVHKRYIDQYYLPYSTVRLADATVEQMRTAAEKSAKLGRSNLFESDFIMAVVAKCEKGVWTAGNLPDEKVVDLREKLKAKLAA